MSTERNHHPGLLGKKLGMTQIFNDEGKAIPVTAIEVGPCYVLQVKDSDKDGYSAVQLGFGPRKMQRLSKPEKGHFSPAEKGGFYHVGEIRCDVEELGWGEAGKELTVSDVFETGDHIDVCGTSKGRGFAGVVKRFGVRGQPASRGTHEKFRNIGSVGAGTYPGRVWKNQKMPGQLGNKRVTVQNLIVVGVEQDNNVLLVRGGVPGPKGAYLVLKKTSRGTRSAQAA